VVTRQNLNNSRSASVIHKQDCSLYLNTTCTLYHFGDISVWIRYDDNRKDT